MKDDEGSSGYLLPSNKFYPPHIDSSQSLLRTELLHQRLPHHRHNKKAIIIEAQAGQGKTTLAYQFLEYNRNSFVWYQIGPEDSDPVLLLSSLLINLSARLDGFTSPQLTGILNEGSIGPLDLTRCCDILLRDLDRYLKHDIYLVFDDLHLIEFGALTNQVLEYLLEMSPPQVHFLFISRQPLEIKGKTIRNGAQIAYLDTADLALGNQDIEELYATVLHKEISKQDAMRIQKLTNGWIMGIILASHPISGRSRFWLDASTDTLAAAPPSGHMLDYFQEEIFAQIPDQLHLPFLQLSFLQEIPADLAAEISAIPDFGKLLANIARENYFIYSLDDRQEVFRFHHFFQEFLQQRGKERLADWQIRRLYQAEADYYLRRDQLEKALTCYRNACDFSAMADILRDRGIDLIAKNKTFTILTLLKDIPEETIAQYTWLILYSGLLRVDFDPQSTLPYWNGASARFREEHEEIGELIALSHTIYFHFVISGEYSLGATLLPRTEALFEKNRATLPVPILIMAARNLSCGYCFFQSDMDKARHFIQLASTLANRHGILNFIASSRFIQAYIELFIGNRARYLREAEACFSLFNDPLVSESNRLTLRVVNLCYLSMSGDHHNFEVRQQALRRSIDQTIVQQSVTAPYLYVWGCSNLFSRGKIREALDLLDQGLGSATTAATDHMRSQMLQWQGFGLALTGADEGARQSIEAAARLREKTGGPFYCAFHHILAGAVQTRLKSFEQARSSLELGLKLAAALPSTYLTICALLNLSYLKYQAAGSDAALDELASGLRMMKGNGYDHFWSWEPIMMGSLLGLAISRNIERDFAESLAKKRLHLNFTADGAPCPLLRFSLMDSFEISLAGKTLFQAKDLTPFQRELLGLLLTAKGQRLPQEKIQLELWPDSSPENARKSFDTLLTRLRKLLGPLLPQPIKEYLFLQKGILCLTNCEIDALQFTEAARSGLAQAKIGDWLQAYHSFRTAISLWKGAMPEDTFRSEQVLDFNDGLAGLMVEMGLTWARHLSEAGRLDEAIALLEQILPQHSLEEELTVLLYRLHCQGKNHLKAHEVLERYRRALIKADYQPDQADQFIDEIVQSCAS